MSRGPFPLIRPPIDCLTSILCSCRKHEKGLLWAVRMQTYFHVVGLEGHIMIGNFLVHVFVDLGTMWHAQYVFDLLTYRDESAWNSLIIGYAKSCSPDIALTLYGEMKECKGIFPSSHLLVCLLNCCASMKDAEKGCELHDEIAKLCMESDMFVGNALVDMYVKCGLTTSAHDLFDKLPSRDVVTWTTIIAGYSELGYCEEALNWFELMQIEGVFPNDVTYICCLKACGCIGAPGNGQVLHDDIVQKGLLESNLVVANTLVDMYAKFGFPVDAQIVFDSLPVRNVVSWNTLMNAYIKCGRNDEALDCFEQMQDEGVSQNAATFICCLKACSCIEKGQEIHCKISKKGMIEKDLMVGNAVVDMYVKCGSLVTAQCVFDQLPDRDVVSWTVLIAGYVKHGYGREALDCFAQMKARGTTPNAITLICAMNACGSIGLKDTAEDLHAEILKMRFFEADLVIGNALIDMYAKCGLLEKARAVFDKLLLRDEVSWNALISAYANEGCAEEALHCFKQMVDENITPDAVTFISSMKACADRGDTKKIREFHAEVSRRRFLERDVTIGNALVDMYCKCGLLAQAQEVFDKLHVHDAVSWNALISGYIKLGCAEEALNRFQQMRVQNVSPDAVTFACTLKACGNVRAFQKGYEIQSEITKRGLLDNDPTLSNAVVDMYAGFGLFKEAEEMFDKLKVQDMLSWTTIISGYSNHGYGEKAMIYYKKMRKEGIAADGVTFSCVLKACGSIGASEQGQMIYEEILSTNLLKTDIIVGNAVVDMYANVGSLVHAQGVFDELPIHDVVSWNSLIAGYAQIGQCENVFAIFKEMIREHHQPNMVTFLSILAACSHAGLVDESHICLEVMMNAYNLIPTCKHYICMLDIFCRTGQIGNALTLVEEMPFHPNVVSWNTILGGCQRWGERELANEAFEHAMFLADNNAAVYVSMSNVYANIDDTMK